jgi:hypothetical protein
MWCPKERPGRLFGSGLGGSSAIEQPEQGAEYYADDDAGDQRKIERVTAAPEHDIAGEAPKPDPRQDRPCDPDDQDHQPKPNQKALYVHRSPASDETWDGGNKGSRSFLKLSDRRSPPQIWPDVGRAMTKPANLFMLSAAAAQKLARSQS